MKRSVWENGDAPSFSQSLLHEVSNELGAQKKVFYATSVRDKSGCDVEANFERENTYIFEQYPFLNDFVRLKQRVLQLL